jgi:hypothetical protein
MRLCSHAEVAIASGATTLLASPSGIEGRNWSKPSKSHQSRDIEVIDPNEQHRSNRGHEPNADNPHCARDKQHVPEKYDNERARQLKWQSSHIGHWIFPSN